MFCLTWSSMNLTGLPINVQRRIALLLHQNTDARAPLSLSVSLPDPPGLASPHRSRPDASNDGSVQPWKLSWHDLGLQLHQQAAVVVRAALGHDKLQARHCCSHKHSDKLPRFVCSAWRCHSLCRLSEQRPSMCYGKQTVLAWEGACSCKLGKAYRYLLQVYFLLTITAAS